MKYLKWFSYGAVSCVVASSAWGQSAPVLSDCSTLTDLQALATGFAPSVQFAKTEIDAARSVLDEVRAERGPRISTFGRTRVGDTGLLDQSIENQVGFRASQTLFDFNKTNFRKSAAESGLDESNTNLALVRKEAALDVGLAYADALSAVLTEARLASEEAFIQDLVDRLDDPAIADNVTLGELATANSRLADIQADQSRARLTQQQAELAIQRLTGQPAQGFCDEQATWRLIVISDEELASLDEKIQLAISSGEEIERVNQLIARRESEQKVADRERLPDFNLVGTLSYAYLEDREEWEYRDSLGLDFSTPIFSSGAISARQRKAAAQTAQAKAERDLLVRELEQTMRGLMLQYYALQDQVSARETAVRFKQDQVDQLQSAYEERLRSLVELVEAREDLVDLRAGYDDARIELYRTAIQLRHYIDF
ncbi:MAG: TolC family protein [Pseudomonadota bacterium]